jgi:hypothetical protein
MGLIPWRQWSHISSGNVASIPNAIPLAITNAFPIAIVLGILIAVAPEVPCF